jgi:hypothetical protein
MLSASRYVVVRDRAIISRYFTSHPASIGPPLHGSHPGHKRGRRLEAEGVVFSPPQGIWSAVGYATTEAILAGLMFRYAAQSSKPPMRGLGPRNLFLKTCDDCDALYLDARSDLYYAAQRCCACFARHRYRYVQKARQIEREGKQAAVSSCAHCGEPLTGRSDRKFCSGKCRVAAHREQQKLVKANKDRIETLAWVNSL